MGFGAIPFGAGAFGAGDPLLRDKIRLGRASGSIQGGDRYVVLTSFDLKDDAWSTDFRQRSSVPAPWVAANSLGGFQAYFSSGMTLASGGASGGISSIVRPGGEAHFDARLSFSVLSPQVSGSEPAVVLRWRHQVEGDHLEMRVLRGRGPDRSRLQLEIEVFRGGQTFGAAQELDAPTLELQMVRNAELVWFYLNGEEVLRTQRFNGTPGTFTLSSESGVLGQSSAVQISQFLLLPTVRLGEDLLLDSEFPDGQSLSGITPAVSVSSERLRNVSVFGPFGSVRFDQAFLYFVPDTVRPKSDGTRTLRIVSDSQIRTRD